MEASPSNIHDSPMADELAFIDDLAGARFQDGVDRGKWRLVSSMWPFAVIAVSSAPRENSPDEFFLRFQLEGYPAGATAAPWNPEGDQVLQPDKRPKGERAAWAFRIDWNEGTALYVPWDRVAVEGHPDWPVKHRLELWDPAEGITSYLRRVHELLNADDYEGA